MFRTLLAALAVALVWWATQAAAAEPGLSGVFNGVADAEGAVIRIRPDEEGFSGIFFDARGAKQRFSADRVEGGAEAVLDMDGRTVLMRIDPLPYGAEVQIIPFTADGRLDVAAGRTLNFLRDGLTLPKPPPDFVDAPADASGRITGNSFLASYEFWSPTGVRNGYLSLPERFRTLLRLYPAVLLDVLWKLCLAPDADRALGVALRGQGVGCDTVIDGLAEMQRNGSFAQFKRDVARDREFLRTSVRCADGYRESRAACEKAARRLSQSAVSLETAATVLTRYR